MTGRQSEINLFRLFSSALPRHPPIQCFIELITGIGSAHTLI